MEVTLSTAPFAPRQGAPQSAPVGRLEAVLWDMDGTLVDTEPYWIESEYALAELHGGTWSDEHALNLVGNDLLTSGRYIREHMGIDLAPEEIVDQLLDLMVARIRVQVPWRPGARELLAELSAAGVPTALVTMSYRRLVDPVLEHLGQQGFDAVVTGDTVTHGKPHPEPYLQAADLLGVPAERCVAIEDSDTGARSAAAAGCRVLCVPNHVPVPGGTGRVFMDSLRGVGLAELTAVLLPSAL